MMSSSKQYQVRRRWTLILTVVLALTWLSLDHSSRQQLRSAWQEWWQDKTSQAPSGSADQAILSLLEELPVKGRAPKTGYDRQLFGGTWAKLDNCTVRNLVLQRDLHEVQLDEQCRVRHGWLDDPYTGQEIEFIYGAGTSAAVQIDHVVAVSDAWQKGAQAWDNAKRRQFYNDMLNLLAVSGSANQAKADADAATWLPSNKAFRCQYVARQIQVKTKYRLWVTAAEKAAMIEQLQACPVSSSP